MKLLYLILLKLLRETTFKEFVTQQQNVNQKYFLLSIPCSKRLSVMPYRVCCYIISHLPLAGDKPKLQPHFIDTCSLNNYFSFCFFFFCNGVCIHLGSLRAGFTGTKLDRLLVYLAPNSRLPSNCRNNCRTPRDRSFPSFPL